MYSKIIIVGFLGSDPDMRYTTSSKAVTAFSLAANREYSVNGERRKETTWYKVTTWGKLAEICNEHLAKGAKVLIEGRITPDPDTGNPRMFQRKDGTWSASYEVTADVVRFLDSKPDHRTTDRGGDYGEDEQPF